MDDAISALKFVLLEHWGQLFLLKWTSELKHHAFDWVRSQF